MPRGVLDTLLRDRLHQALIQVPSADTRDGRTALLDGIPTNIRLALNRSDNAFVDLINLINQIDQIGRLDNGERPVVMLVNNACRLTRGSELGRALEQLSSEIERKYDVEAPLAGLSDTPEVLIFGGSGEWVEGAFLEQAKIAGGQVARLSIPRFIDGENQGTGYGTGWLVTQRFMLTNYHVIEVRDLDVEKPATPDDFKLQAKAAVAWFDYHNEGNFSGLEVAVTDIVSESRDLDYVLLRLENKPELQTRRAMKIAPNSPMKQGIRLNIVQCPGGGPLRYAIRNNFFVGIGKQNHQIRYLTDTRSGSSGSPVLNDSWQVIAMHRGAVKVNPQAYRGEDGRTQVAKFHNEGVAIHDILAHLPPDARAEIGIQ
jgi:V8-like Glu-specific endopeptidase